jgi:D-threonate/D-erythronate kinase
VQFVRAGWDTELRFEPTIGRTPVVAMTTDTRNRSRQDAARIVGAAVAAIRAAGIAHIYKKIDSTMRGQVRAELEAVLDNWSPRTTAVVCPAFPALGRTVRGGELRVNDVPVAKTALAADPVTPVTESHIPTLIGGAHVASAVTDPPDRLAECITRSGRIVVLDAASDDDLGRIADAVVLLGGDAVAVGSAGLARHLAVRWRATEAAAPAIVIVTSLQETARRQAAAVEADGALRFEPTARELADDAAWASVSDRLLAKLNERQSTVLLVAPADRTQDLPAELIPRRFAALAASIVAARPNGGISGIAVTGGDGARALVNALGASGIALRDEITTGVPVGTLTGGRAEGLPIATKAGGFGGDDTLVRAAHSLRYRRFS